MRVDRKMSLKIQKLWQNIFNFFFVFNLHHTFLYIWSSGWSRAELSEKECSISKKGSTMDAPIRENFSGGKLSALQKPILRYK